jgi:adenine-specific DNA methylase
MKKQVTKTDKKAKELSIRQKAFLQAYQKTFGNITMSCDKIDISRETYYDWLKNPKFKKAIENTEPQKVMDDFVKKNFRHRIAEGSDRLISEYVNKRGVEMGMWSKQEQDDASEQIQIIIQTTSEDK